MAHRLARYLAFALLLSGLSLISTPLAAQDSPQTATTNSSRAKVKKAAARAATEESTKTANGEAKPADAGAAEPKKDPAKAVDAKKGAVKAKEDVPPPSPQLIEVPQGDVTYTSRPKVVAVFVFTNGSSIESDDYLITKDALFINKDGQKTRYPINSVDRAATKSANQGRGVDIVFPKSKSEFNLDF